MSTSRTFLHKVPDGRPVPGTYAAADELLAFAEVLREHGAGVFEGAMRLGERDNDGVRQHPRRGCADGRDQSPQWSSGQFRTDPEQPTARPVRARDRLRQGRERRRCERAPSDHGARCRHAVRPGDPHAVRPCAVVEGTAQCRQRPQAADGSRCDIPSDADLRGRRARHATRSRRDLRAARAMAPATTAIQRRRSQRSPSSVA